MPNNLEEEPDISQFEFQKKARTNKQKRNCKEVFKLVEIHELAKPEAATDGTNGLLDIERHVPSENINTWIISENNQPVNPGEN